MFKTMFKKKLYKTVNDFLLTTELHPPAELQIGVVAPWGDPQTEIPNGIFFNRP